MAELRPSDRIRALTIFDRELDAARHEGFQMALAIAERALYEGPEALYELLRQPSSAPPPDDDRGSAESPPG